ncbi:glycosyltransferase family 4 protein [Bacillus cereus group sp. MYBK79-1]|uniref:glycosyltransferase family 4 protein n=1 Tax=unclassified Bacillus cereus group TaxID=2750818 RepID=UPI003F7919E4
MDKYYKVENQLEFVDLPIVSFKDNGECLNKKVENMKILYVTFFKYPNVGGLANYISTLKEGFEKLGHKVDVISPLQMPVEYLEKRIPEEAKKISVFFRERYGVINEKIIKNVSFLSVFTSFLEEKNLNGYDVFHAQDLFSLFILRQFNLRYRKPLFFTPHGHFTQSRIKFNKIKKDSIEELYFSEIEKQGIETADKIITISDSFHSALKKYGAKSKQLVTVYTGINFKEKIIEKETDKIIVTCIARLSPRKGHTNLLSALSQMKGSLPHIEVWIVGDGVMREDLEQQVKFYNLKNVKFLGNRKDIAEILAASDVYILPTINDNFPLSIIEAMFAGKAIISTNCGGIVEMIQDGKTGLLCEPGNVQQIVDSLTLLIRNSQLRLSLGKNAKEYARKYLTQERMVSEIEEIYYSLLEG